MATITRPIAASPSTILTSTPGASARSWSANVLAGKSWPSPTLAVKMRTRGGKRLARDVGFREKTLRFPRHPEADARERQLQSRCLEQCDPKRTTRFEQAVEPD